MGLTNLMKAKGYCIHDHLKIKKRLDIRIDYRKVMDDKLKK